MPLLRRHILEAFVGRILAAMGASRRTSKTVAEMLVRSNLFGVDSHGVMRIPEYIRYADEGRLRPSAQPKVVRKVAATATIDGRLAFGQITGLKAMRLAISLARKNGVGAVTCYNTTHTGRLGDYTELAAKSGMIGLFVAKAPAIVAPWGGTGRLLGANPISFAIPTDREDPIVADFSTSASAEGKIRIKRNRGENLPKGWIIDSKGAPSIDPHDFYDGGAILPFGEFKGYALSLLVEALGGAMTGQGVADEFRTINGVYAQAINIESFVPLDAFRASTDVLVRKMRNSRPARGFERVMIPGEPESLAAKKRLKAGIPIDDDIWEDLKDSAKRLEVAIPDLRNE